ncbi:MAG: helix-turn-helix transcriptional regulator [Campylobacteraceae bacterium]|nr:helix-turn-helix transcriptional regulator [Campylobacteraceae bacterium]
MDKKEYSCYFQFSTDIIGGKWKSMVLWSLKNGIQRNGELKKAIPKISQKMLTQQLRELEEVGIVKRIVHPVVPPKVEYELTAYGAKLIPILEDLHDWGKDYAQNVNIEINLCPEAKCAD